MGKFISFKKIGKTKKKYVCVCCKEIIDEGLPAYGWTSVEDNRIYTKHAHDECGQDLDKHCFHCARCAEDEMFVDYFMKEALSCGMECPPCDRLRKK